MEEWLEALSILRRNQGRSQAAPLAASRQRTRCRDRTQPQRSSRMLRDSYHSGTDAAKGVPSSLLASLQHEKTTHNHSKPHITAPLYGAFFALQIFLLHTLCTDGMIVAKTVRKEPV